MDLSSSDRDHVDLNTVNIHHYSCSATYSTKCCFVGEMFLQDFVSQLKCLVDKQFYRELVRGIKDETHVMFTVGQ